MGKVRDWIDRRTGYRYLLHALLLLNFPVSRGARWRYIWGGSLALMFLVQIVTGTLLMTVYSPSEASAWGSVQYIESAVEWGWLVRGIHHYTSHTMLAVILLHTVLVVVTAGYRRPKEFTFWSGLILACVVLGLAVSGNPLPWDQKGYWAYQIETGIAGTMPVAGSGLRSLMVGGSDFGNLTLTRLYTLHVVVLPVSAAVLLVIHVALMRREKLHLSGANPPTPAAPGLLPIVDASSDTEPYWPYQTTRNLVMFLVLMGLVVALTIASPRVREWQAGPPRPDWEQDLGTAAVTIQAPADAEIPYAARPEWYVRFLFELRQMVSKDREVLVTGLLPVVILLLLFLMPSYEKVLGYKPAYCLCVGLLGGGLAGILGLTAAGFYRDWNDPQFLASRRVELDYASRAVFLAKTNGIPPEGPTTLLHNDPKAMGPLLFAAHCANCHRWNGHDGTGRLVGQTVEGKQAGAKATAGDLYNFGRPEWIAGFLSNPLAERYFGHVDQLQGGEAIKSGEMASWAEQNVSPNGPLTEKHINAVATLVARESGLPSGQPVPDDVVQLGVAVFSGGELKNDNGEAVEFDGSCIQCHRLSAGDPNQEGAGEDAPDLNGYASAAWLRDFIRNPSQKRFYGDKNAMPAFDADELSDKDLGLLVAWMRSQWQRPKPVD